MNKRQIVIGIGIAGLAIGWYAFRPELLFVNKLVNEQFPAASSAGSSPVSLASATSRAWLTPPKVWRRSTSSPTASRPSG